MDFFYRIESGTVWGRYQLIALFSLSFVQLKLGAYASKTLLCPSLKFSPSEYLFQTGLSTSKGIFYTSFLLIADLWTPSNGNRFLKRKEPIFIQVLEAYEQWAQRERLINAHSFRFFWITMILPHIHAWSGLSSFSLLHWPPQGLSLCDVHSKRDYQPLWILTFIEGLSVKVKVLDVHILLLLLYVLLWCDAV